jgi:Bacterial archaeo-eukaryotic release factor family 10
MATDPVEQIERHRFVNEFETDLDAILKRLAVLPPSMTAPYLTVSLDWRPEGSNPARRMATRYFTDSSNDLIGKLHQHRPKYEALSEAVTQIKDYLDSGLSASAHGVFIVAGGEGNVFEPVPLGVSVSNKIAISPTPALSTLARVLEEQASFAVLVAEQNEAVLTVIAQERPASALEVEGTLYPRKQKQGGWSQRRYRARANERVAAFARAVAEETRKKLDETKVSMLVVSADEDLMSELNDAFHQTVHERIIGTFRHDPGDSESEVIARAAKIVASSERKRELEAAEAVRDGAAAGGRGVAGPEDVLTALQAGQVMMLVMDDDFRAKGWADYSLPLYGTGAPPKEHPAGGDAAQIVEIAVEEEMVRLAVQSDSEIELVRTRPPVSIDENTGVPKQGEQQRTEAALMLDTMGGVGAVLRFALDAGQSTADL